MKIDFGKCHGFTHWLHIVEFLIIGFGDTHMRSNCNLFDWSRMSLWNAQNDANIEKTTRCWCRCELANLTLAAERLTARTRVARCSQTSGYVIGVMQFTVQRVERSIDQKQNAFRDFFSIAVDQRQTSNVDKDLYHSNKICTHRQKVPWSRGAIECLMQILFFFFFFYLFPLHGVQLTSLAATADWLWLLCSARIHSS